MGGEQEKEKDEKKKKKKRQMHQLKENRSSADFSFRQCSDVKGLKFGAQLVVKSFTVRRASPLELLRLLALTPLPSTPQQQQHPSAIPLPSTITYLPTNFSILAQHAWHTLTLGLGTRKSKVVLFIFESEGMKSAVDRFWPPAIPLGEVNRKLIRGLPGCEMARFKFRKGCLTFYLYAVRHQGAVGFSRLDDLRMVLQSVADLKDFLDHTAMLALPAQRSICFTAPGAAVAMAR